MLRNSRLLAFVAGVCTLFLLAARVDGAFELRLSVTQGSDTASFTFADNQPGDVAITQQGYLVVNQVISLNSGATLNFSTTTGTSKPNAPNGPTVRHMSLSTTTVQVMGAETSPVTVRLDLVDTDFAPLNQYAPAAALENTFTFNPLYTSATGTFQSYVGLDNQNFLSGLGSVETAGMQTANGPVFGAQIGSEIDSPSSLFSMLQVAEIKFTANGTVQLTAQTQVHTPEPATAILWSTLGLFALSRAAVRRNRRQQAAS